MPGYQVYERAVEVGLILGIAEALRVEFGVGIDAHPGGEDSEAGAVNRAFRAAARVIIAGAVTAEDDPGAVLKRMLGHAARRRLSGLRVAEGLVGSLLRSEPGLGERWFAYLALAPDSVVEDLCEGQDMSQSTL